MNKIDEIEAKFKKISPFAWHWSDAEVVSYVGNRDRF